jgi:F0F1-type ATP synthase epsilon subunit
LKKILLASTFALATVALVAAFATSASATPGKTSRCSGCHSGVNVPVTATQTSNVGGTAAYTVSAPTATAIAVFDGTTKLFTFTATTGSFSVADGKTYTIYAIEGPTETDGYGTTSISPVAPVVTDAVAPVTTSDALTTYVSSATIKLTAIDNVAVTHTYYRLDGAAQVEGTTITLSTVGSHSLSFWSVDAAGNVEVAKTASFTITAPVPVPDTAAPVTTSNALTTYVSSGTIKLTATDNIGVAHTYYVLDGAAQIEGTSVTVSALGSHTLSFWSVDAAGNVEVAKTADFTITAPVPVADTKAPVTASNAKASYAGTATITLSASDNVGVAHTYYVLDGGVQVEGTSVTVSAPGSHTLSFWSIDAAGNVETAKSASFTITSPVVPPVVKDTEHHKHHKHHLTKREIARRARLARLARLAHHND